MLQVPEQREAAEREIRTHRLIDNKNIVKLIASEIKDRRNGDGVAYLLFPYYQVSSLKEMLWFCIVIGPAAGLKSTVVPCMLYPALYVLGSSLLPTTSPGWLYT